VSAKEQLIAGTCASPWDNQAVGAMPCGIFVNASDQQEHFKQIITFFYYK
jgi:hypothetical protein